MNKKQEFYIKSITYREPVILLSRYILKDSLMNTNQFDSFAEIILYLLSNRFKLKRFRFKTDFPIFIPFKNISDIEHMKNIVMSFQTM
jgi:hypothetical protein